jgi:hypothetical protein
MLFAIAFVLAAAILTGSLVSRYRRQLGLEKEEQAPCTRGTAGRERRELQ